jgi:AcrR family transcriptional regulator
LQVTPSLYSNTVITAPTPYADAQARGQEALRGALLDVASAQLVDEGPHALTMRRIAQAAGCSTTVLYTLFGSKEGIAEGLFRRGFELFAQELAATPAADDPVVRLAHLAREYRASALKNPAYYRIMFGRAIPGYEPSDDAIAFSLTTLQVLVDAVRDAMDAGAIDGEDAWPVAVTLWVAAHGAVSLEVDGYLQPEVAEQTYWALLAAAFRGLTPRESASRGS